jgi:hypothetical protein
MLAVHAVEITPVEIRFLIPVKSISKMNLEKP